MGMKRRIFSLVLCLLMVLSMMPTAALAEGEDDDDYIVRGFDVTVTGYEYGATVGNTTATVDTPGVTITELVWNIPNNKSGTDAKAPADTFDCRTNTLHIFYTVDEPYIKGFKPSDITINGSKPTQIYDNYKVESGKREYYILVYMPNLDSPCTEHTPSDWMQWRGFHRKECTACRKLLENKSCNATLTETVITPPTCTEEGVQATVCSVCGYEKDNTRVAIPAAGHTMGEWNIVKKPTADEAGSRSRVCTVCGYTETQELAAGTHIHELTYVAEVPATKFAAGIAEHYYCPECGGYFLDEAAEKQVTETDLVIPQLPFETITDVAFSITGYEYGKPVSDAEVISQTPGLAVDRVEWSYGNTVGGSDKYGDSDTFDCHDNMVTVYYRIGYGYINNIFNGAYPGKAAVTDMGDLTAYWTSKDMVIYLPALSSPCGDNHTPGEWIRGNGHHDRFCTVCGYHMDSDKCTYERKEVKAPTCTENGYYGQVCTVCGWVDTTTPDPIRALGHSYGESYKVEPTCTEDGYYAWDCTREGCGFVLKGSSQAKLGHKIAYQRSVPATCTEPGLTEGYYCSRCSEVLMAQETIPAKGHTPKSIPAVAATCTESGSYGGKKCADCGEILTEPTIISAMGHTPKSIPAVAATCTESGSYGGKKCADCGEILTEPTIISAMGHDFSLWNYVNDTEHQRVCKRDPSHVETGTHTNLGGVCDICGSSTEHIIVRGFDIAITGYEYGAAAGGTTATTSTPGVTITDIVWNVPNNKGGSNAKAPTDTFDCRTNSVKLYYTFNEPYIDGFTIDDITVNGQKPSQIFDNKTYYLVYMPQLDSPCEEHTPGDWMQWNGFHRKECTVCRETLENVSCNATYVETVITPPTCTEEGVKANVCSICGYENVNSRRNIPATGHTMGEWSIVKKPTAEEAGSQTRTCTVCGYAETQELAAGTHIHTVKYVAEQAATKFEAGVKAHYLCTDCRQCFSDAEAKNPVTDADLYIPLIPFDTITDVALDITGYEYGKSISDAKVVLNTPGISIVGVEWSYRNTVGGSTLYDESATFDCHDNTVAVYFHLEDGYYNNIFGRDTHGYVDAGDLGSLLTYVSYGMHNTLTMHMLYIYLPDLTSPCGDNHTPGEWIRGNGHHDRFCTVCGYHMVSDKCTKERTVIKPSTCTEDGYYGQVCTVCGWVDTSTPDPIARLGHVLGAATVVAPTCTEQGYTVRNCTREGCDYAEKSAFTAALGHTVVTDRGMAATCTTAGLTDGSHCSVCGETLEAQKIIPEKGHHFVGNTCDVCGYTAVLYGDVNGDSSVNEADLTALLRHVAKIEVITNSAMLDRADMNRDSKIDAADVTLLARQLEG